LFRRLIGWGAGGKMASASRRIRKTDVIRVLLEKADVQGYLTTEDLMEAYPEITSDADRMESILMALRRQGVDVLDEEEPGHSTDDYGGPPSDMDPYSANLETISSDDTIGLYLKEMSSVPLLSVKEELDLARRIETGRMSAQLLIELNGHTPHEEYERLNEEVDSGDQARDHLIKANTRLVVSIAKRYMGRGVPFLDLIQEGNLGLMKAVEKYEYQRGFRFSTYATWWIRQTITRSIADQGRTIRVPVHMVDRIRQLYRLMHELEQKLGRVPTD